MSGKQRSLSIVGPRLAAVGVVASLFVLGLEVSALAASPTISSFSPTSGPTECVMVIRGRNFSNPVATSVDIGGIPVSAFKVVSGSEIWATVAGNASGTIHVATPSGTASSGKEFTNENPGKCSPTIAFFTPCGGPGGTVVTVIGSNLLKSSGTATNPSVGADMRFAPYAQTAAHTGTTDTPTQLSVVVPTTNADGAIRVSTFNDIVGGGAVLSDGPFLVPPPEIDCAAPVLSRSVTLRLAGFPVARGSVREAPGFTGCAASVPVKIRRRVAGGWQTVRVTSTNPTGSYKKRIPDKPGKYRANAPPFVVDLGVTEVFCLRAISGIRIRL